MYRGTEVLLKLKEIDSKVKAYFITGDQGFIDKQSPQSLGVLGYLLKPIDVEEVLKIIDEL